MIKFIHKKIKIKQKNIRIWKKMLKENFHNDIIIQVYNKKIEGVINEKNTE